MLYLVYFFSTVSSITVEIPEESPTNLGGPTNEAVRTKSKLIINYKSPTIEKKIKSPFKF